MSPHMRPGRIRRSSVQALLETSSRPVDGRLTQVCSMHEGRRHGHVGGLGMFSRAIAIRNRNESGDRI
jgi:hypothetical protein